MSKEVQLLRGHLQEREREFYQEQLQEEIKKKEQIQQDLQQERDEQVHEKAALQKFNEDTTHLKATLEAHIDQLQKELQKEKHLISHFMKQKGKEVKTSTVSEKDDEIKSLKNKLEEEKKLRQELQGKIEPLEQKLQQLTIPQSGMCDYDVCRVNH